MISKELDTDDFHAGVDYAIEAMAIVLGVGINDFSHDAATETMDGDVMAVIGNCLNAKFGEDGW